MLNRASLTTTAVTYTKDSVQLHWVSAKNCRYMMNPGATPNEIASTSESSSAPKRDPVLVKRATLPSSTSSVPAKTMNQPADIKSPREAEMIA
jgi:hypothetical protein